MDTVLFLMDLEKRFNVRIPDERAAEIVTVGDLYVFLLGEGRRNGPMPCPTSQAFYRLRRTLIADFGAARDRVRPSTMLRTLFPAETRAAAWPRLAAALGLPNLPDPDPPRPRGPTARAFGIALASATAAAWLLNLLVLLLPGPQEPGAVLFMLITWLGCLLLVCEGFGLCWLTRRLRPGPPLPKVRDLVVRLVIRDHDQGPPADTAEPDRAAVWADLAGIISTHTGLPAKEIRPELRFMDFPGDL
jgi:hypothetical protein